MAVWRITIILFRKRDKFFEKDAVKKKDKKDLRIYQRICMQKIRIRTILLALRWLYSYKWIYVIILIYPDAEERRLFYVAMTRAKKKVILVTLKDRESDFVKELHTQYAEEMKQEAFICPLCGGNPNTTRGAYGKRAILRCFYVEQHHRIMWCCSAYSKCC